MGLFDRIKASVGIGGAKIALDAPHVVCAGSTMRLRVTVMGGKLDQDLKGIELVLACDKQSEDPGRGPTLVTTHIVEQRIATSDQALIAKGSTRVWDCTIELPGFGELYDGDRRAAALLEAGAHDQDPFWFSHDADEPLPTLDEVGSRTFYLRASADIPGAVDPVAHHPIVVLPEARGGESVAVGRIESQALCDHLRSLGVVRSFPVFLGERWLIWFTDRAGRVAALADLKAVAAVRPDGVVRAYTNPRIPPDSVLPKLPSETSDRVAGDMPEARTWAERLVREADVDALLARPVGNSFFALSNLRVFS
jgi:hypothetical protein